MIGEKRAREIWFLCRQYSAEQALRLGPGQQGRPRRRAARRGAPWADEILRLSPTALRVLKQSFNVDTEQFAAIGQMAFSSLEMFADSAEAQEGITAFNEKRAAGLLCLPRPGLTRRRRSSPEHLSSAARWRPPAPSSRGDADSPRVGRSRRPAVARVDL